MAPLVSVVAIGALIASVLGWVPDIFGRRPDYSRASRRLHADFTVRLQEIGTAYKARNQVEHLKATAITLRLADRTSIRALLPEIDQLVAAIARDGLAPYASMAIDVGYRLARIDNPNTQRKFRALAKAVLANADRDAAMAASRMPALIRREGRVAYRQYDEPMSIAVARIAFTDYGLRQMRDGQTPSDLARTVSMAWECQRDGTREQSRSAGAKANCRRFLDLVTAELSKSAQAGMLQAAMTDLNDGIRSRTFDCLEGERHGLEMVKSTETIRHGPNGNYGRQVDHHYTNASGGTRTVTEYAMVIDGNKSAGTHLLTDDGQGTRTQEHFDESGELTSSFTVYDDTSATTFEKKEGGGSVTVSTDKKGVSTIVVTDPDGKKKEAKIDLDGTCTGAACDNPPKPKTDNPPKPTTPVGETDGTPACTRALGDSAAREPDLTADPLGPYIYPSPETALANPLLSCLVDTVLSPIRTACPPSVALCLEPPPAGSCGCGTPQPNSIERNLASRCSQIMCAEGDSCDPLTGVCQSQSSSGSVGLSPPTPTARRREVR